MKYIRLLIFIVPLLILKEVNALECSVDGRSHDTETVADIIIPKNAADGSIIWKSDVYTKRVTCKKSTIEGGEYVYFYPFPHNTTLPEGMSFILVYNDKKYPLEDIPKKCGSPYEEKRQCLVTNIKAPMNEEVSGDVKVQLLIIKRGTVIKPEYPSMVIYQLDGEGGLRDGNYYLQLTNLNHIATGECGFDFKKNNPFNAININDELISQGVIINNIATLSISCNPIDLLKNRMAGMNVYTEASESNSMFGTNKDGLRYSLMLNGSSFTPVNKKSNPLNMEIYLNENAKAEVSINQKIQLSSPDENWLYQNDTDTISNNPKIKAELSNIR